MPLGFCDFQTLETDDVIAGDRVRPDGTGEIFHGQFNPNHKWSVVRNMPAPTHIPCGDVPGTLKSID